MRQDDRPAATLTAKDSLIMSDKKVWFITGATRGLGVNIARAALDAGHAVVATGRTTNRVSDAVGPHDDLLVVELDVTDPASAQTAVDAAVARFGTIDVLVNNAGNFIAGTFEEIPDADLRAQMETNFFGPVNVTRAVLPVMRGQRSGHVITVSSMAGLIGMNFCSAYAASKFALEGWSESLGHEVAQFGIAATVVEPGFFRTELLTKDSTRYAEPSIEDYRESTTATIAAWSGISGQQAGDPAKLAHALVHIAAMAKPPVRWVAGADAVEGAEGKARELLAQVDAHRDLSSDLAHDEPTAV